MADIIGIYRFALMIVAVLSVILTLGGGVGFMADDGASNIVMLITGISILLSLGIPAILLEIMDDIKAMRKLQEEQAIKDK